MGWLWMCLGIRDKSSARRIGGRVSSDTYLAPQYDPTKTPRIEDYLQPRRAGYDAFVDGHPPESPTWKCNNTSSAGPYDKDLAAGQKGTHLYRRSVSESFKGEYGPYWGYPEDMPVEDFVSIEFPRVTPPSTRKSFSELLIETDTLDKGPLALAAMAAAAERAARSLRLQKEGSSSAAVKEVNSVEGAQKAARVEVLEKEQLGVASLSKDHLETSNAVAAFKESRRQSQMAERSPTQEQTVVNNPSYISNLFRSSRKRSLPFKSRSFQRALSPVPEVLSLEEELRSRRKSDVALPTARGASGDCPAATSSGEAKPDVPPLFKKQRDSELVTEDNSPSTEEWDGYVVVERVSEMPPRCESLDVDPATSSVNGRILDGEADSSSGVSAEVALQDDAMSSAVRQSPSINDSESQQDETLLRTPVRDTLVTPEVFISPKTTTAELNFTRVMDMDPEDRPIFGSLADHWEAAWATKRPTWDGKGIPNSTNKYREDQKVMWHATPFEERLAQALATQQDSVPQRRNSFNGRTSRLAASRSDRGLQAH